MMVKRTAARDIPLAREDPHLQFWFECAVIPPSTRSSGPVALGIRLILNDEDNWPNGGDFDYECYPQRVSCLANFLSSSST
jgi:hypothetical protein